MKYFRTIFLFMLIFGLSATLMGNESATYYFPEKLGSSWVYEDQDGNELTRYVIEKKNVDGETFRAFSYEPAIDNWEKYEYYIHPFLYQIGDEWVAFYVGDDIENAVKSLLGKELDDTIATARQQTAENPPPGITMDFNYTIEPKAQDYFYVFPTLIQYNEKWVAMQLDIKVKISLDIQGAPVEIPQEYKTFSFTTNIIETGNIIGTEKVKTEAGTFEKCLKIEYRTKTTVDTKLPAEIKQLLPEQQTNESVSTLWLAPNVGIVKFRSEQENSDDVNTLELKSYEIKTDQSESENNN